MSLGPTADLSSIDDLRSVLRPDCAKCAGLCCVAPAFSLSADFAIDKAAAEPCPNLRADFACGIHARLRDLGFPGCAAYDCFGAGQRVVQELFGGEDWRANPAIATRMFAAFSLVRQLHELLWYLTEALALPATRPLQGELRKACDEVEGLVGSGLATLETADAATCWQRVNTVLRRASALARAGATGSALDRRGADLVGADLRASDLRGADLRGALLVGADLHGADLGLADLTGADLRGADLAGADLRSALFVVQSQLESAHGDLATALPPSLRRPAHWV